MWGKFKHWNLTLNLVSLLHTRIIKNSCDELKNSSVDQNDSFVSSQLKMASQEPSRTSMRRERLMTVYC